MINSRYGDEIQKKKVSLFFIQFGCPTLDPAKQKKKKHGKLSTMKKSMWSFNCGFLNNFRFAFSLAYLMLDEIIKKNHPIKLNNPTA